jgi:hypothetical protein
MFIGNSKFSKSDRRMTRAEIENSITYLTEAQVTQNKSGNNQIFEALPQPMEKDKLAEALKQFEATPKE